MSVMRYHDKSGIKRAETNKLKPNVGQPGCLNETTKTKTKTKPHSCTFFYLFNLFISFSLWSRSQEGGGAVDCFFFFFFI